MAKRSSNSKLPLRDGKQIDLALRFLGGAALSPSELKNDKIFRGISPSSHHKTFGRDLAALREEGLELTSSRRGNKTYWQLDPSSLVSDMTDEVDEYSRVVATMARGLLTEPGTSDPGTLGGAIVRSSLSTGAGTGIRAIPDLTCSPEVLSCFEEGLRTRTPVQVDYQAKAESKSATRLFRTYGIFSLAGFTFVVGYRQKEGTGEKAWDLRTYNLSRVKGAALAKDEQTYVIPADFSVDDYKKLPFEIGPEENRQKAYFYIPPRAIKTAPGVTRARNQDETVRRRGGSVIWPCEMCSEEAAAKWAIENGLIPLRPQSLVDTWKAILEEARRK